jgi:hypothetical protein
MRYANASEFLRVEHEEILATWAERSFALAHLRRLPGLFLMNHLPELLEALAARLDDSGSRLALAAAAIEHAIQRSRQGVPLDEVVSEMAILRAVIEDRAERSLLDLPRSFAIAFDEIAGETTEFYGWKGALWAGSEADRSSRSATPQARGASATRR